MRTVRKLRAVPNCPQPEPPPYKPIQYGYTVEHVRKLGSITASPLPHEATIIARVQSMRTRGGVRAEPLSYEASVTYLWNVDRVRKRGVTVPRPLNASLSRDSAHSLPATAGRPGAIPPMPADDEAAIDDYYRRALAGEFIPF